MRFNKFHPILAPLIAVYEHGGVKCPSCNDTMHHKVNMLGTLRWLLCIGCENQTTIFQTAGQEYYDDLEMVVSIVKNSKNIFEDWFKINFDCGKQELRVFPSGATDGQYIFKCDLPKWESLHPDYIAKKIKLYLTFS